MPGRLFRPFRNREGKPVIQIHKNRDHHQHGPTIFPQLDAIEFSVHSPHLFGNAFKKGDRVLYLHFNAKTARDMIELIRLLKNSVESLKQQGFTGVFGDTPNESLIRSINRKFSVKELVPPDLAVKIARRIYKKNVEEHGFSKKYLDSPVRRLVIPFE